VKISSTTLEFALTAERDALHYFLVKKILLSKRLILIVLVFLNSVSLFGGGWVISYYLYPNANIIRVLDAEFLYNALFNALVIFPTIIVLYLWQPLENQIAKMLNSLRETRSIKEISKENSRQLFNSQRTVNIIISLILPLIFILIQHFFVYPVENSRTQAVFLATCSLLLLVSLYPNHVSSILYD
jgi:hypothetical protein